MHWMNSVTCFYNKNYLFLLLCNFKVKQILAIRAIQLKHEYSLGLNSSIAFALYFLKVPVSMTRGN